MHAASHLRRGRARGRTSAMVVTTMPTLWPSVAIKTVATRHRPWGELSLFRGLWHRPHVHGDRPIWFDRGFPNSGQNDLPIWSDQIVVTFCNMRTETFDMQEGLSY